MVAPGLLDRVIQAAIAEHVSPSGAARSLSPAAVLRLQRSAGNRAVVALVGRGGRDARTVGRRPAPASGRKVGRHRVVQRDFLDDVGEAVSGAVDTVAETASDVAGQAWDVATEAGGAVAGAAGEAWEYAESGAEAVAGAAGEAWDYARAGAEAVGSAAGEVASGVADVASDVSDTVAGVASDAWDTVSSAASEVGDAVAEGAARVWDEATDIAGTVVDGVTEVAGDAWDRLASTARSVASGASEVAGTVWDAVAGGAERVWNGLRSAASSAWDTARDVASGAWDAIRTTASEIAGGVRDLAVEAWNSIRSAAGAAWDAVSGALGSLWNSITNGAARLLEGFAENVPAPGKDVRSRGLTDTERQAARGTFGDSIDYDLVVVTRGSLLGADTCRTTANTISMSDGYFDGDTMNLTDRGVVVLIHELTHVKQYQEGGLGYIPESLWDQYKSWRKTGTVDEAYDWRPLDAAGVPWDEWHVEPQAQAVEDYNEQLRRRDSSDAAERRRFDPATLARLQKYTQFMRQGPR